MYLLRQSPAEGHICCFWDLAQFLQSSASKHRRVLKREGSLAPGDLGSHLFSVSLSLGKLGHLTALSGPFHPWQNPMKSRESVNVF